MTNIFGQELFLVDRKGRARAATRTLAERLLPDFTHRGVPILPAYALRPRGEAAVILKLPFHDRLELVVFEDTSFWQVFEEEIEILDHRPGTRLDTFGASFADILALASDPAASRPVRNQIGYVASSWGTCAMVGWRQGSAPLKQLMRGWAAQAGGDAGRGEKAIEAMLAAMADPYVDRRFDMLDRALIRVVPERDPRVDMPTVELQVEIGRLALASDPRVADGTPFTLVGAAPGQPSVFVSDPDGWNDLEPAPDASLERATAILHAAGLGTTSEAIYLHRTGKPEHRASGWQPAPADLADDEAICASAHERLTLRRELAELLARLGIAPEAIPDLLATR